MTAEDSTEQERNLEFRRAGIRDAVGKVWSVDAGNRPPAFPTPWPGEGAGASQGSGALTARFISGEQSPIEGCRESLARAEALQPTLNAFVTITADEALRAAAASEDRYRRHAPLGPLDGVPIALKDLIDLAGSPTTAASPILAGNVARADAEVTRRLKAAGAIVLGKTNLHQFAYGAIGDASHIGPTRNPHDLERSAGGSSSGSAAAVAAGICPIALGTDTGGSIRIPAALCGIVGLKPTYGHVSTAGILPLSWSLDHAGPLASSVQAASLALAVLCDWLGPDLTTPENPTNFTVGTCEELFWQELDGEVHRTVEAALGVFGEPNATPIPHIREGSAAQMLISSSEAYAYHRRWLSERLNDYDWSVSNRLLAADQIHGSDYVQALRLRGLLIEEMSAALSDVDVLAMPTCPIPAPRFGETAVPLENGATGNPVSLLLRNTLPANLTGFPAISLPCGRTSGGLPIGLQLIARPGEEGLLLRAARAFEGSIGLS